MVSTPPSERTLLGSPVPWLDIDSRDRVITTITITITITIINTIIITIIIIIIIIINLSG